jgi:hypothetical protein
LTEVLSKPQRRVRSEKFILDRLRQNRAQCPRNPSHGAYLQPFRATARHEVSAVGPSQRRDLPGSKRREYMTREIGTVERELDLIRIGGQVD